MTPLVEYSLRNLYTSTFFTYLIFFRWLILTISFRYSLHYWEAVGPPHGKALENPIPDPCCNSPLWHPPLFFPVLVMLHKCVEIGLFRSPKYGGPFLPGINYPLYGEGGSHGDHLSPRYGKFSLWVKLGIPEDQGRRPATKKWYGQR